MTAQLRQAVARALCRSIGLDPDDRGSNGDPIWNEYVSDADAAIAVIRESLAPTPKMTPPFPLDAGSLDLLWRDLLAASPIGDSAPGGAGEKP